MLQPEQVNAISGLFEAKQFMISSVRVSSTGVEGINVNRERWSISGTGRYEAFREGLVASLARFHHCALDNVSLNRENALASNVTGELTLVCYYRRGA